MSDVFPTLQEARAVCREQVEAYIEQGNRSAYRKACEVLASLDGVHKEEREREAFRAYVDEIADTYDNLPAFRDELRHKGL